ncbi:uncharacterized protein BHQ10_008471 [Talaromyces amestolkiae]|uniref:Uncharacterized protein n=1 Tax=Talaromyces amestolkiae TaxID=1196081 RepID=A0A364L9J9_TALAM|nr:uncharacterized protein BHQ10_008471 [Talaromyces amestolkiae]RAO72459.1 hypothetical protein BHQ10_008471 [Talaromyces amestolkiae]
MSKNPSHPLLRRTSPVQKMYQRYFEYYFHHAAPSLSGTLDHSFWGVYVLQLCRSEPAIWDGLISLSALFERPPVNNASNPTALLNSPVEVRHEYHHDALAWYSRSLAGLRRRISGGGRVVDVDVVLVGTIIYIAIEFLQANYKAVMGLYTRGMQLIAGNVAAESGLEVAVKAMFRRLRTQILIFSSVPMSEDIPDHPALNERFESIDSARNTLFELISDMKQLLLAIKSYRAQTGSTHIPSSHQLTAKQAELEQQLHNWYNAFTTLSPPPKTGVRDPTTLILLMNHTAILLETRICLSASESAYDSQNNEFEKILKYAYSLSSWPSSPPSASTHRKRQPFSFDLSTFLPLFITALKCRDPALRRKALCLLSGGDSSTTTGAAVVTAVQGLFLSRPAAQLIAIIVGLEERSDLFLPASASVTTTPLNPGQETDEVPSLENIVKSILSQNGCIPKDEHRICDFWISSSSEAAPPELLYLSAQGKRRIDAVKNSKGGEVWLYYRRFTCLEAPVSYDGHAEEGGRKMGYVTRRIRLKISDFNVT